MKELHEALDIVLEAKEKGIEGVSLDINTSVRTATFWHINDIIRKQLTTYYCDDLKDYSDKQAKVVALSNFTSTIKEYLKTCE